MRLLSEKVNRVSHLCHTQVVTVEPCIVFATQACVMTSMNRSALMNTYCIQLVGFILGWIGAKCLHSAQGSKQRLQLKLFVVERAIVVKQNKMQDENFWKSPNHFKTVTRNVGSTDKAVVSQRSSLEVHSQALVQRLVVCVRQRKYFGLVTRRCFMIVLTCN